MSPVSVGLKGTLDLGLGNPLDGAHVLIRRKSARTGAITVEILERHGAYAKGDSVVVQPCNFKVADRAAGAVAAGQSIDEAIKLMRRARTLLRQAGARRAYLKACLALNSAEGAARHAAGLAYRRS